MSSMTCNMATDKKNRWRILQLPREMDKYDSYFPSSCNKTPPDIQSFQRTCKVTKKLNSSQLMNVQTLATTEKSLNCKVMMPHQRQAIPAITLEVSVIYVFNNLAWLSKDVIKIEMALDSKNVPHPWFRDVKLAPLHCLMIKSRSHTAHTWTFLLVH